MLCVGREGGYALGAGTESEERGSFARVYSSVRRVAVAGVALASGGVCCSGGEPAYL